MLSEYLPEDILIDILSRLPVKTLLEYRSVSKTWCSLISASSFITRHLNKATTRNNDLLLFTRPAPPQSSHRKQSYFFYQDKDFPKCNGQELDFPLDDFKLDQEYYYDKTHVVGSCNGLLCFVDVYYTYSSASVVHVASIRNPSIGKVVLVPEPTVSFQSHGYFMNCFGFGFDSINDDYKLVRIVYLETSFDIHAKEVLLPPLVEVYSLKSGCWRMVENDLKYVVNKYTRSAFVNGACHWPIVYPEDRTRIWVLSRNVIVFFNLADERFGEMVLPDGVFFREYMDLDVTVFDGLLSVVALWKTGFGQGNYSIWAMKEYGNDKSWIKLFNIEHLDGQVKDFAGFKKNGEIFLTLESGELISYSKTKNGSCRILRTKIWGGEFDEYYLQDYMESLVLLNEPGTDSTASAGNYDANSESKKNSSHVADVDKNKKEKRIKKQGKKNIDSPEIGDVEENKVFDGDAPTASSSGTSRIVTKEGDGDSKELDFGAKNRKQKEKKKKKKKVESDDEANEMSGKHNSTSSTDIVGNGTHKATKELPSSSSNTDKKKRTTKKKKGKNINKNE